MHRECYKENITNVEFKTLKKGCSRTTILKTFCIFARCDPK